MIEAGPNSDYMLVKGMIDFSVEVHGLFGRFRRFISKFIRKWIREPCMKVAITGEAGHGSLRWRDA